MMHDACEMLQPHDIARPRLAQKALDKLMAGSRVPFE